MIRSLWLLASDPGGMDWLALLGPFAPFGVLAVGMILDQRQTIKELRSALAEVNSRLVDAVASSTKVATEAVQALAENTKALTEVAMRNRDRQ